MMMPRPVRRFDITDADLEFIVNEAAPDAKDKERLKELLLEDKDFRKGMVGDDKVFQRVMTDDEIFLKISPTLYFEVLLRKALTELEAASHTLERAGRQNIPVFDAPEVVDLLSDPSVLDYLAQMLASFIRIQSYTVPVRVRPGVRRRIHYNDMDIDSLMRFAVTVDEDQRFAYYKRIADVCLFISGLFPEYAYFDYRYPMSGQVRPLTTGPIRRSIEDYEEEGRRFYGLAEEHEMARLLHLTDVLGLLRERFNQARKPLSFISAHYLHARKQQVFGAQPAQS
jgi:hypothetical protein